MVRSGSLLSASPILRLLFAFCSGVYLSTFELLNNQVTWVLLALIIFLFLVWSREASFYFQPVWSLLILLIIIILGLIRANQERVLFPVLRAQTYCVVLDDYPKEKEKTLQAVGLIINSNQRVLVYLPKTSLAFKARPGTTLVFKGSPDVIENEGNPFEFDYRNYLNDKGIGYRIFLREGDYYISENPEFVSPFHKALIFRKALIDRLAGTGIKSDNVHLVGSVSFGARDEVGEDTIQSFTNTGVIHVLAVSGMNVGLIYIVLNFMFSFLKSGRTGLAFHTFLVISGIWGYTILAGMSASILRAAVMFTFVIVGNAFRKNTGTINAMSVSAFVLIAWNPFIIRDIGFQLSYVSLLSIVVIQPFIYKQLYFRSFLADKTWQLLSVTLAAQAGTLPFTLLYFHQFPVYFWLANLVVVPLVSLILYLSFVVLFLTMFPGFVTEMAARVLDWSGDLVMFTVRQVEKLPHSVIGNIHPAPIQILLFITLIGTFCLYTMDRRPGWFYGIIVSAILLMVAEGIFLYLQKTREEIVFYNIPGTRALVVTRGTQSIILYDRCVRAEEKLGNFMNPYYSERGIQHTAYYKVNDSLRLNAENIYIHGNVILYHGVKIYLQPIRSNSGLGMPLPAADLTWLFDKIPFGDTAGILKNSGIILYRQLIGTGKEVELPRESMVFNMNRSVLLTFNSQGNAHEQRFCCTYFSARN